MMRNLFLLIVASSALLLAAACDAPPRNYTVQGTVRNVWCGQWVCYVVFEHDTQEVSTITVNSLPPVWVGEHVRMTLEHREDARWDIIARTERLP